MQQWQPVRRWRAAAIAGVLVALAVVMAFWIRPVPDRVVAMLGVPLSGVERVGGLRIRYRPPAEGVLVLDFPEASAQKAPELADILVNGVTMRRVLETDSARALAHYALDGVTLETDLWDEYHGHRAHLVPYLTAPTGAQLEHTLARATAHGWRPTDGSEILLEPQSADRGHGLTWRTYEVSRTAELQGRMIASATASNDPLTGRPLVLLDFTPEGGRRFCDLTTQIVGHKLAILLGSRVRTAPVIESAICGGRASITMGSGDIAAQEAERGLVVSILSRPTTPPGGTVDDSRWYPPAEIAATEWMGRLLLGVGSGGLVALLVGLALALVRPSERVRGEAVAGPFPWRRLAITLLGPVALIVGQQLMIPGLHPIELEHVLASAATAGRTPSLDLSVVTLGVVPILSAFGMVELVALGFPKLRWRRHDPQGRMALARAVAVLVCVTTLVQGLYAASYIETLSRGGMDVVISPGWQFHLLSMLTLSTGTLLLGVVAGVISTYGLGNGYGVLLVSTAVLKLAGPLATAPARISDANRGDALGLIAVVAVVVATAAVLRWRIRGGEREAALAVPTSGIMPLSNGVGMVLSIIALAGLATGAAMTEVTAGMNELGARTWLGVAVVAGLVAVWSWLFAAPALTARVAVQAKLDPATRRTWARATLISAVLLVGVAALIAFVSTTSSSAAALADPVLAMIGTAVVLDAIADGRAHRRALAPAGVLHQIQLAGLVELTLAEAGIPLHLHASHLRTLFAFFGPWAPVIVLVPVAQAAEARRLLDDLLRPLTARRSPG